MKNTVLFPHCRWCSSQRRWVVKRPSPWPPEPRPEPMPGLGAMPPRGGGPLPSRSRIIPLPTMPREPPGPRSLRLMSRRSSPPRVSRSRTALVFFSSTFRRTSPRNMMGCRKKREKNNKVITGENQHWSISPVYFTTHIIHWFAHNLVNLSQTLWKHCSVSNQSDLTSSLSLPVKLFNLWGCVQTDFSPVWKNPTPLFIWLRPAWCRSGGRRGKKNHAGLSGEKSSTWLNTFYDK